MKQRILFFLCSFLISTSVLAQYQPSSLQDNYAGVSAAPMNPASIADNRYILDINLFSTNYSLYNNYIALKGNTISGWASDAPWDQWVRPDSTAPPNAWQDPEFQDKYLFERLDGQDKSVHNYNEVMLPSFLYTLNEKSGIAFTWRIRSILNVDGISEDLARLIYRDLDDPDLQQLLLTNPALSIASMNWVEYSAGYARTVYDQHKHFVKVGGNFKLVQGMNAMYMQVEDFNYTVINVDQITLFRRRVNYGRSKSWDPSKPDQHFAYAFDSRLTPALDIGAVWEFRPNREKYKYDMDGEYDLWMNNKNKYKLKVGMSITDIGRIRFDKSETSGDYIVDIVGWDISQLDPEDMEDFDRIIDSTFGRAPGDERSFDMWLPTALSFQIDYNIWNGFYANFTPYIALYDPNGFQRVHNITSFSLTPRYEHKWFGVSVPFSYNAYRNTAMGLAVRFGPVTVGTNNFAPYIFATNIYGSDGYFALKVPLFRPGKPRDRDEDKISDKRDVCPEVPGLLKFDGCPDIDNDGVPDIYDDCPADSGLAEFRGCPDTDGDGIIDKYDECIDLAGIIAFKGCPDSDGDSLIDPQDSCPTVAGLMFFHGCPDTDGDSIIDQDDLCPEYPGPIENGGCPDRDDDGIFDYLDDCPEVFGPKENNGCPWPDTDLDGILDKDDRCPNNPGPAENDGCPYADTDGDSILDKDDDCPNVPGVPENNGCPEINKEEQEILNTAFADLEFLSGKAIISKSSYTALDELAGLLEKKPDWGLKLAGHTDNVGTERDNLILSKRRAEAVQKYLSDQSVEKSRIKVEYYGETQPIESNETASGRQKNRRVEMDIVFE